MNDNGVLIVGGGLAAQRCAETLRRRGYDGPVRMVCAEPDPPYDRPPLSKELLAGTVEEDVGRLPAELVVRGASRSSCCSARAPRRLDPESRTVRLDGGARAGLRPAADRDRQRRPRALPVPRGLRERPRPAHARRRAPAAGGAAPGRAAGDRRRRVHRPGGRGHGPPRSGVEVTMIEALATPLAPILGAELGAWFAELHRGEGVRVITGAMLEGARGSGRVEELVLDGGERIACDAVVVGVGTAPATGWLRGSGLDETGVRTDTAGRTVAGRLRRRRRLRPVRPALRLPRPHRALGRRRPGRAPPPPRRCSASTRARRRCRASGATSTGCGSSTSATPTAPTRCSSRATPTSATSRPSSPAAASRSRASPSSVRGSIPALKKRIEHGHWPAKDRAKEAA